MAFRTSTKAAATSLVNSLDTSGLLINTTTGDLGVGTVQTVSAQPLSGFSDLAGNTWNGTGSPAFNQTVSGVHYFVYLVWAQNIIGHTNEKYTATCSGGTSFLVINVGLFSGRVTSGSPFDGTTGTSVDGSAGTSHTGPSVSTSNPNSDLWMMGFDAANNNSEASYTAGASGTDGSAWALSQTQLGSANSYLPNFQQYSNAIATSGTKTAPWTSASSRVGIGIMVALLAQPGAGSAGHNQLLLTGVG